MNSIPKTLSTQSMQDTQGMIVKRNDVDYYKIAHVDAMDPFFISLVSDNDHWLFAGSTGGLTMGRVSPETAVFPYITVDKVYESALHTGPKTIVKVERSCGVDLWEPFNREHDGKYEVSRHLYKSLLGNALIFEEINHSLSLAFSYEWQFSDSFGFSRSVDLKNIGEQPAQVAVIDGLQNVLPAGTPRFTQAQSSNLVDAYKWTELDDQTGLALYTLYSAITDRAEPVEALKANTIFHLGHPAVTTHLNSDCIERFKRSESLTTDQYTRGVRGAYFTQLALTLAPNQSGQWSQVIDLEKDQSQVVELQQALVDPEALVSQLNTSIAKGDDSLSRIMAASDGFQHTAEPVVTLHHYANTLFNVLRGGIFADQYRVSKRDLLLTLKHFNSALYKKHHSALNALDETLEIAHAVAFAQAQNDPQLERLIQEYLPITFGRRHGDPSRPWNQFAIELTDNDGQPLLSYQGNWRDIFQNWEALSLSYPSFVESVIAKFVNASTIDGYNPYRITKQGIDWEVEEPDDPWSYIGYWGDHQIIYLLKLLEWSAKFHPETLATLLEKPIFSYANVPYRIKSFSDIVKNPKDTVTYDDALAETIEQRVSDIGADGKLILNSKGQVYQVSLLEKLMVPLLTKLSNFVINGGIWLNTQRPEWNDANNALVGQGLSMVTLYYMNRYVKFMQRLITQFDADKSFVFTQEIADWLASTQSILAKALSALQSNGNLDVVRHETLVSLGETASDYRNTMYNHSCNFTSRDVSLEQITTLLDDTEQLILDSIRANRTDNGVYHAYNILNVSPQESLVEHLYEMLEGQVAVLSSQALSGEESAIVVGKLFDSAMYRDDQKTFMLYPDREQTSFLQKNTVAAEQVSTIPLLHTMHARNDGRIIKQDASGVFRFNSDITNANAIEQLWPSIQADYPELATSATIDAIKTVYESVFKHSQFTGRSGGMFGFEGLGCIYWHMVSKLLLAVQETAVNHYREKGLDDTTYTLLDQYYHVREGIGFNKTPEEYGAFPADPYSHTPKHAGAQQPGMTGQVKEELLSRMTELGCFVDNGQITFDPFMLRAQEFTKDSSTFRYLDCANQWQQVSIPEQSVAFTWCQVPIVYTLSDAEDMSITVFDVNSGSQVTQSNTLDRTLTEHLFSRDQVVSKIHVLLPRNAIYQP